MSDGPSPLPKTGLYKPALGMQAPDFAKIKSKKKNLAKKKAVRNKT